VLFSTKKSLLQLVKIIKTIIEYSEDEKLIFVLHFN